ncbi:MAG: hypothetical protein H6825_01475 [Planctomycetes bacterium]|nr:hypothetical protein [Planctomycetota bacterium]
MMSRSTLAGRALAVLLTVSLLSLASCAYVEDRVLDLSDVLDVKYGAALGVGAKVELTHYIGVGGGLAVLGYNREWFGRRSYESDGCAFVHFGVIGADGGAHGCRARDVNGDISGEGFDGYLLLCNVFALDDYFVGPTEEDARALGDTTGYADLPVIDQWRVGAEFIILPVQFGLYLNLGELVDFLVGFTTYDLAHDDGAGKGEVVEWPSDRKAREEAQKIVADV